MKTKKHLVYAGRDGEKRFLHYRIDGNIQEIDYSKGIEIMDLPRVVFGKAIIKNIGGIFEVETEDDAQFHFSKKAVAVAVWGNLQDRAEWKARDVGYTKANMTKRELSQNAIKELLKPIAKSYRSATTMDERRLILAEVIRFVMEG